MLELNNVEVIYSDVILVLKGINMEVQKGQIVALLGANGAGKTTTLKAVSGLLHSEDGKVTGGTERVCQIAPFIPSMESFTIVAPPSEEEAAPGYASM